MYIEIILSSVNSNQAGTRTILASFEPSFLRGLDRLVSTMQERFPELGLVREDCVEMSWIRSIMFFAGFRNGESLDVLLNRTPTNTPSLKAESDHVKAPISKTAFEGIYEGFYEIEAGATVMLLVPYGRQMSEIPSREIQFPHRAGNIFKILYLMSTGGKTEAAERRLSWIRRLYCYMDSYVSKSPRAAYMNYRDLDIGKNNNRYTSVEQASVWGVKYFKNNFNRLVKVKTMVDPGNFFWNEQSIPLVSPARN